MGEVGVREFPGGHAVGVAAEDLNLERRPAHSREYYYGPENRGVRKREQNERGRGFFRGFLVSPVGLLAHG